MREEGLRNIIIAPTREGRKVDRWGKGWRGGQGSIGFTFSSESVLKVTYGNVGGQKCFRLQRALVLATFLSPAFFSFYVGKSV